jgi:small subunit ribosomal protein S16
LNTIQEDKLVEINLLLKNITNLYILIISMLKLRLKRAGRKRSPSYRLIIMENRYKRDGRPIDEVGYYNPISKQYNFEIDKIKKWLNYGVKPTTTVLNLLKKSGIVE